MNFFKLSLFSILLWSSYSWSLDWSKEALNLTGESAPIRSAAISRLKKKTHLKETLRSELKGPRRPLAFDVISALQIREFVPELLQLAKTDESGISYLTVNSLLNTDNAKLVVSTYRVRLIEVETRPIAKVILLDSLGTMGVEVPEIQLEMLLNNPSFEVRIAVVDYLSLIVKKANFVKYESLIKLALKASPYQVRLRTIFLVDDLPAELESQQKKYFSYCLKDSNEVVRKACVSKSQGTI